MLSFNNHCHLLLSAKYYNTYHSIDCCKVNNNNNNKMDSRANPADSKFIIIVLMALQVLHLAVDNATAHETDGFAIIGCIYTAIIITSV